MNIKDLKPNEYKVVNESSAPAPTTTKINVKDLPAESFKVVNDVSQETSPAPVEQEKSGGVGGFVKSLISAPLTMLARPIQAGAELLGASAEDVDSVTKKITGGFVAPVPQNFSDVKKDVGRGIQTVAFGAAGPVSAGAALGFGSSLEEGNDVFSGQTLFNTVLGAAGGKVLDLVGKPIIDAAGKLVGKITPQYLSDVASKGTQAIEDFAAKHNILPEGVSKALTKGAQKAEEYANVPFDKTGQFVKGAFTASPEKIIAKRASTFQKLEDNNASLKKYASKQASRGFVPSQDANVGDLVAGSVDNTGTIRTTSKGGAIEQYHDYIKPRETAVSDALKAENRSIPLSDVHAKLVDAVDKSGVKGASRAEAFAKVNREIEGYKMELDPSGKLTADKVDVPISFVHDAKVDKYANVNYLNENGRVDKAIAKGLKELVEKNTSSVDVKALNNELSKHYANMGYLERLNGKKVEGGRLGKYFAKTIGAIAGGHFGPLGSIAGAELAGAAKGKIMQRAFGSKLGLELEDSPLMKKALENNATSKAYEPYTPDEKLPTIDYSSKSGSRKAIQTKTTTATKNSTMGERVPSETRSVKSPTERSTFGTKTKKYTNPMSQETYERGDTVEYVKEFKFGKTGNEKSKVVSITEKNGKRKILLDNGDELFQVVGADTGRKK